MLDPHRPCLYHPSDRAVDGTTAAECGLRRYTGKVAKRPQGEPDSDGISAAHALVRRDGLWHLVYAGVNEAHNHRHSHGTPTRTVMHATCEGLWEEAP